MDITKHAHRGSDNIVAIIDAENEARKAVYLEIYTSEKNRLAQKFEAIKGWGLVGLVQICFGIWGLYTRPFAWGYLIGVVLGLQVTIIALCLSLNNRAEDRRIKHKLRKGFCAVFHAN
jgi:hypothetical protein